MTAEFVPVQLREIVGAEREQILQDVLDRIIERAALGEHVNPQELIDAMRVLTDAIGPIDGNQG